MNNLSEIHQIVMQPIHIYEALFIGIITFIVIIGELIKNHFYKN